MPAPTPAPELTRTPPRRVVASRTMSQQRRFRLRRTMVGGGLLLVAFLLLKILGPDASGAEGISPSAPTGGATGATAGATTSASAGQSSPTNSSDSATSGASSPVAKVVQSGDGKIAVLAVPGADTGVKGTTKTFTVEAEGGLGLDLPQFAAMVRRVLSDPRGWERADGVHFVALSAAQLAQGTVPDIRITLASPDLTDTLCAPLRTMGEVSCNQNGRAIINAKRWALGVSYYPQLDSYRTYVINHEVGHSLNHPHAACPGPGQKAPIMQQQTLGLQGCTPWPFPVAS